MTEHATSKQFKLLSHQVKQNTTQ